MSTVVNQDAGRIDLQQPQLNGLKASVNMNPAGGALALQQHQHLRMRDATGWTVKALAGTIWITQESDSRDIVLKPGDSFVLDRKGAALISSLGDARLCLQQ